MLIIRVSNRSLVKFCFAKPQIIKRRTRLLFTSFSGFFFASVYVMYRYFSKKNLKKNNLKKNFKTYLEKWPKTTTSTTTSRNTRPIDTQRRPRSSNPFCQLFLLPLLQLYLFLFPFLHMYLLLSLFLHPSFCPYLPHHP